MATNEPVLKDTRGSLCGIVTLESALSRVANRLCRDTSWWERFGRPASNRRAAELAAVAAPEMSVTTRTRSHVGLHQRAGELLLSCLFKRLLTSWCVSALRALQNSGWLLTAGTEQRQTRSRGCV